jgi:hypothetical protein
MFGWRKGWDFSFPAKLDGMHDTELGVVITVSSLH